ncbi:MAG: hypothetical protein ACD_79C01402G0008 [uncultured bacterium]|nr:MAG: hypothetical protein ACD_79C01402G0008 [uncultured bacterium]
MKKRIESLTLNYFRGAVAPVTIPFDADKSITMIFGENGSGKSSIVDAIDFVCNSGYGSISEKSSVDKKNHIASLGKTRRDISVSLKYDGKDYLATHSGNSPLTNPSGCPNARILIRSTILDLIDAKPGERYEALSGFFSVPNIMKAEATLKEAINEQQRKYEQCSNALHEARDAVERLKKDISAPGTDAQQWAQDEAKKDTTKLEKLITWSQEISEAQKILNNAQEDLSKAESVQTTATESEINAKHTLKILSEKFIAESPDLIQILTDTSAFLSTNTVKGKCPVCEQQINEVNLKARIQERLKTAKELTEQMSKVRNLTKQKETAENAYQLRKNIYYEKAEILLKLINTSPDKVSPEKAEDTTNFEILSENVQAILTDSSIKQAQADIEKHKQAIQTLKMQEESAKKSLSIQAEIKRCLTLIEEKQKEAIKAEAIFNHLKKMGEILRAERKSYVEGILQTVSSELERLFLKLHPGEGLGGLRMFLNPDTRASLEYVASFQGKNDIPPQAYYSEAHLDTLGICLFLAISKHFAGTESIIVLDDIITSVDQSHLFRFMQLLHDEESSFAQLIITTHYRIWRDQYKFMQGPSSKVHFIDLQEWGKATGIRWSKCPLEIDDLNTKINANPFDRQSSAGKSGVILESALDFLALTYRLNLPRSPVPKYTLGELLNATSKLRKLLKVKIINDAGTIISELEIKPLLDKLDTIAWIRNEIGCHWNINAGLLSDAEVKDFAKSTIALCEALACKDCGSIANRKKSGSFWQCQCGKLQMFPLEMP